MKKILCVVVTALITVVCSGSLLAERVDIAISADDGFVLKGSFYSANIASPGVLLLHQCNADRKVWEDVATMLSMAGANVLTFDFRGFGDNRRDDYTDYRTQSQVINSKMPGDVEAAYTVLISQKNVTKSAIGIGGAGCGVNQAIQVARRHPEVKTLVLLSGGTDVDGENYVKNSKIPFLAAATEDDKSAAAAVQKLFGLSSSPQTEMKIVKEGFRGSFGIEGQFQSEIVNWFKNQLIFRFRPTLSGVLGGTLGAVKVPPPPPPPPSAQQRLRVDENAGRASLLQQVRPVYPPLARQARIQGAVVLEAEISKEGTVEKLTVISGHPLLVQAAIDAVKQWKYKPLTLNNEPVPVVTNITVNFAFANEPEKN